MQLLAADYQNIGPFEGERTVIFQQHATLIQAPVGSGKSFLFFDGVVFGLYKYSQRPLLHRHAESGAITIVFEQQGNLYLIYRSLTHGKTKDRTQSTLYRVGDGFHDRVTAHYGQTVLHADHSLREGLQSSPVRLTEIPTKTDTDLQSLLEELLPPRTVFTHTQLLLQDSDNVFTMSPSERITVFQHLFALLDVDVAKEMVAEAKKDTQTRIRILSDTSRLETKYRQLLTQIQNKIAIDPEQRGQFDILFASWLEPIQSLDDIAIEQTTLPQNREDKLQQDITQTQQSLQHLQKLQAQRDQQKAAIQTSRTQLQSLQSQQQQLSSQIDKLQQQTKQLDTTILQHAATTRDTIIQQYQQQLSSIDRVAIQELLLPWIDRIDGLSLDPLTEQDPRGLQQIITRLIAYGKELRTAQQHAQQLVDQTRAQQHKDIQQTTDLIQTTQDQLTTKASQLNDLQIQIHKVSVDTQQQQSSIDCPHCGEDISDVIHQHCSQQTQTSSLIDTLTKQHTTLQSEITLLEHKREEYQTRLETLQAQKPQPQTDDTSATHLQQLSTTMTALKWQHLQTQIDDLQTLSKRKDQAIAQYESLRKQADDLQTIQLELTKLTTQKESISTQITTLQESLQQQQSALSEPDQQLLQQTQARLQTLQEMQISMHRLTELHEDLRHQIHERKDLELRDTKLKNLHHILSKEIMYIVLENALPSLFAIINSLLAQVVDYQLHFALIKTGSDRLELEVEVEDAKGRRPTSSLSGGQKVILKLAWILAVASYMRLPLLLLDETINNLDADLIARVAELIDDVIRKQEMTLYVVTHSPHIQQMNVWEEIVEVR